MAAFSSSTLTRTPPFDSPPPSGVQLAASFSARVPDYAERGRFWARRLHIPDQDVEDLVQEVLTVMWEHLPELAPHVWLAWFDTAFQNKNKRRRRNHARWQNNAPLYAN